MKNLDLIAEELFNKIRGRFPSVTIGNDNGEVTNVPKEARFYDFDYKEGDKSLGKISVSLTDQSISVMYSDDFVTNEDQITKTNWYNFLKELRVFAKKRLLNFDTRDINKSNLDKRDYKFLATNRPGEVTMESKMYGTSKTSYQNIGNARLAIKHFKPVNTESATGRIQNIKAIYIESGDGERFRYPAKHINGARAMARHVSEGGKPYDDFGKHITGLSEELANLKKFKNYVNRSGVVAEGLGGYIDVVNERLNAVKKTISGLQKESSYRQAVETFEAPEFREVPDDVAENWIDQLTIKQFNEELKDVFPYIYRLVSEATRAKELGPEDILGEAEEDDIYVVRQGDTVYDLSRRSGTPVADIIEINALDDNATIRVGQELIVPNINQIGASPTTPGATRGINPQDAYSPDDFQRLTRGTPAESFESQMNKLMGQFAEESNQYEITPAQRKMATIGHKMRHGLEPSSGIDWEDRDFNLAAELSTQLIQLGTSFGPKTIQAALRNVGPDGIDVEEAQRLIRHAMGEEEKTEEGRKRDVDGDNDIDSDDYMAARDVAIKKAMRQNDDEEVREQELPLSEFILGYFDRHSGQFPKGETAVLTMVEKQYGENFITPAKQFIEMINNKMAEMMGYRDPDLNENPEQDLNQQILGFLRHLMQNDRQLGYRASDLARQHPGQPKMALQALQSDPEINKMWQDYTSTNRGGMYSTTQPQDMNTRTTAPGMNTRTSEPGMNTRTSAAGANSNITARSESIDINTLAKLAGLA